MSGEKLRLMCLVWPDEKPDNHIVEVKIDNDETVVALKDMIKDKHAHSLRSVDARDLVLWKCSIPDDKHLKETLNAIHFDGTDPSVERLVPLTLPLSEHFKFEVDLSQRTIHVLVEVPVLGECSIIIIYPSSRDHQSVSGPVFGSSSDCFRPHSEHLQSESKPTEEYGVLPYPYISHPVLRHHSTHEGSRHGANCPFSIKHIKGREQV